MGIKDRLSHAWNAFFPEKETFARSLSVSGPITTSTPDRVRFRWNSERTILASIYTRIAIDVASNKIEHVRIDEDGLYQETIKSSLNNCLTVEANIDQAARHFRQNIAMALLSEGSIAVCPTETNVDPWESMSFEPEKLRVGSIVQWSPQDVTVRLYDERVMMYQDVKFPKRVVAVMENPLYEVMNEPNSTLQRLNHKLSLLDRIDEISSQGKLDLIIQLPYQIKTDAKRQQAEVRRKDIETQLTEGTYGIAYTDGSEKVIQLNRSVENNLLEQIQYLKEQLYAELGLTEEIMNGTADDVVMMNYQNRTVEPILDTIVEAMRRTFLTKTARTQGQTIMYFQQPFKLIPISMLADIVDALSRNQIVTPNDIRSVFGMRPSKEPQANMLVNSNMPLDDQVTGLEEPPEIDDDERELDRQMSELGV